MTQQPENAGAEPEGGEGEPKERTVADFLLRNPDFFQRHPELLETLEMLERWSGDGVVDMQRYLLDRRSTEIDELRNCAQEVIETSRSNMSTQTRTHAAVLALLATTDLDDLGRIIVDDLPFLLDVDVVAVGFEPQTPPDPAFVSHHLRSLPEGTVDAVLGVDQEVGLFRNMNDDGTLFGSGAGLVRSAAVVRLRPLLGPPCGAFCLGSRSSVFHPGQGTELISFLARVVEAMVQARADTSP